MRHASRINAPLSSPSRTLTAPTNPPAVTPALKLAPTPRPTTANSHWLHCHSQPTGFFRSPSIGHSRPHTLGGFIATVWGLCPATLLPPIMDSFQDACTRAHTGVVTPRHKLA